MNETKGAIVKNPELVAINTITKALNALDEKQRARVLNWLFSKFDGREDSK